jgi:SAM-dependent methyltransferase
MIEVSKCVICDGKIRQLKRALVAPFLAKRIWNRTPFCVDLMQCEACGFMFYNPRLDDADLQRLYGNYRSEEYQKMRYASEPWYTSKFNTDLASPGSYEFRRAKLAPILGQHVGQRKISRVLDYGGDRGDLVAGLFDDAETFVYDISGVAAATGVTATLDPAGCTADLIINSNVLEHVGFPRLLVGEILRAAPEGGLVFLEVPCEFPFGLARIARRIAQIGVMALTRPALARFVIRPASLYLMHEHINYFTEQSLSTLMRSCGGTVIAAGSYPVSGRAGKADIAWCLGVKHTATPSS